MVDDTVAVGGGGVVGGRQSLKPREIPLFPPKSKCRVAPGCCVVLAGGWMLEVSRSGRSEAWMEGIAPGTC